jgi:hypothetical protein
VTSRIRTALGFVGLLSCFVVPRALHAETMPTEFPPGVGGLFWGESVKSAQRKCETFTPEEGQRKPGKGVRADCVINGVKLFAVFDAKGKLRASWFAISPSGYKECADSILAAIGIGGRSEDKDGFEIWDLDYANSKGARVGWVMCVQTSEGPKMGFGLPL